MPSVAPLFVVALLLLAGVLAGKVSGRFGIPALLLFLVIGMLAGSDGPGGIAFDDADLTLQAGSVALAFILFSGGLDTRWQLVRPVLLPGISLVTVGTIVTAAVAGVAASVIFDFPLLVGLLVGVIVSPTDAAAVFSVLRARSIGLRRGLRPLLEFESASNDPMAVILTIGLIELILTPEASPATMVLLFLREVTLGSVIGIVLAYGAIWLMNRLRLEYEGLYPVLTVAFVLLIFSAATAVEGSGFLAVYLAAVTMSRHRLIHKRSITRFHDGVGWLMQIAMFLLLGLLVFPSELPSVALPGLGLAMALMFLARPLAVVVALLPFHFTWKDRALVSWVGLRGAVPIVLATFPLAAGVESAGVIFHAVFFVVFLSVAVQGTTISLVANWLGLGKNTVESDRPELITGGDALRSLVDIPVPEGSWVNGKRIVELDLPPGAWVTLVTRHDHHLVPQGPTVLYAGDRLTVLASRAEAERIHASLARDGSQVRELSREE
jgi:cell volume regulation protein A